jgi:hypothetical protein
LNIGPYERRKFIKELTNVSEPPRKLKECPCDYPFFIIYPADSAIKMTKNINDPSNWNKELVKAKFSKSADYTVCIFEVNQSDIH